MKLMMTFVTEQQCLPDDAPSLAQVLQTEGKYI
jgi:hypothetical protein